MVKSVKAEGQPKRPMSAYFLWMNDVGRAAVKEKNPGASITEVSKKCGEEWRAIGDAEKKKYERMQEEAKKKFDEDMNEWMENGGEEAMRQARKETQAKKDKKAGRG